MQKILIAFFLVIVSDVSCEKDQDYPHAIIGKWQLYKGYNLMVGGDYYLNNEDQRIEEYSLNGIHVDYDYLGNEISRCNYYLKDSFIVTYGKELNGKSWENSYQYWLSNKILKIRHNGGFEYYDEYFKQIK